MFGFTANPVTYRRMAIYAGVRPCLIEEGHTSEGTIARMLDEVVAKEGAKPWRAGGRHHQEPPGIPGRNRQHPLGARRRLAVTDTERAVRLG